MLEKGSKEKSTYRHDTLMLASFNPCLFIVNATAFQIVNWNFSARAQRPNNHTHLRWSLNESLNGEKISPGNSDTRRPPSWSRCLCGYLLTLWRNSGGGASDHVSTGEVLREDDSAAEIIHLVAKGPDVMFVLSK